MMVSGLGWHYVGITDHHDISYLVHHHENTSSLSLVNILALISLVSGTPSRGLTSLVSGIPSPGLIWLVLGKHPGTYLSSLWYTITMTLLARLW